MNYEILSLRTAKKLKQQELEIDRLNDIFDELEKWLKEKIDEYKEMDLYDNADMFDFTLNKLQELRSGDCE